VFRLRPRIHGASSHHAGRSFYGKKRKMAVFRTLAALFAFLPVCYGFYFVLLQARGEIRMILIFLNVLFDFVLYLDLSSRQNCVLFLWGTGGSVRWNHYCAHCQGKARQRSLQGLNFEKRQCALYFPISSLLLVLSFLQSLRVHAEVFFHLIHLSLFTCSFLLPFTRSPCFLPAVPSPPPPLYLARPAPESRPESQRVEGLGTREERSQAQRQQRNPPGHQVHRPQAQGQVLKVHQRGCGACSKAPKHQNTRTQALDRRDMRCASA